MKVLLVDVEKEEVKRLEIEDSLDAYYMTLGVDCIDIPVRKVGGRYFDIICDDEGLCKSNPKISAVDSIGNVMLVGNLLFAHHNDLGEMVGLSDEDFIHLEKFVQTVYTRNFPKGYPMVTHCEY